MSISITRGKGFQMEFANGYKISVQIGEGNYCANQNNGLDVLTRALTAIGEPKEERPKPSPNAEIAVFYPDGEFVHLLNDDVQGYVPTEAVGTAIALVQAGNIVGLRKLLLEIN